MIKNGTYKTAELVNFMDTMGHPVSMKINRQIWRKNGAEVIARRAGTWTENWKVTVKK